jgi:NAD(P)-dependent dehydrogenase (short-subunit alcohol dehydrogenase family)
MGGNSGLGLETARALEAAGAAVNVVDRNVDVAKPTLSELDTQTYELDLTDPASMTRRH